MMLKRIAISIALFTLTAAHATEAEWKWVRVEAGLPSAVVMQGQATTISESAGRWTLNLSDRERTVNDFVVRIRQSGGLITVKFEPPNTERVLLQFKGVHRETPTGDGKLFEEMIFAEAKSGNFLLLSRFKKKSKQLAKP
jgi:hypothetical protein